MKPETTGPLRPGATDAPAWICALVRLSFVSADCEPVKSRLLIVAVRVSEVNAALNTKRAVPKEASRRAFEVVVGWVGGTSCEVVRFMLKSLGDRQAKARRW